MTDWNSLHAQVVTEFTRAWSMPGPGAFDAILDDDVELVQPMLRDTIGRDNWDQEILRLQTAMPNLTGEVLAWAGSGDSIFVNLRLVSTQKGKTFDFTLIDHIRISPEGMIVRRDSYFDSAPLARNMVTRPTWWLPWWKSGAAPLAARRKLPGFGVLH